MASVDLFDVFKPVKYVFFTLHFLAPDVCSAKDINFGCKGSVMRQGKERPERGLFVEHDITVSTYEIDFAAHVSNIVYLRWFEDMRLKLFEKYFPLKGFLDEGKTPVIACHHIQYRRPIKLFDKPHGLMWISHLGRAMFKIEAELYVDGQITTTVEHEGVFVDLASGKPIRVPERCAKMFRESTELIPF